MKTRILFLLLITQFTIFYSSSQYSISGIVLDNENLPIPSAIIKLLNTNYRVQTDSKGEFSITKLPPGSYVISATQFGFETTNRSIILVDENVQVNFSLIPSFFMQEGIEVHALRATEKTPTTFQNINREQIEKINFGQDLPFLLQSTPSSVVTSDAGAGVGYTGIRIRGVDPTRTNVTINGIPINDSESQGVFWVNMPDLSSSISDIQIQRGLGTSTNGSGAFGSSININSNELHKLPYGEIDNGYGSYNTWRNTIKLGTGLMDDKFSVDARISQILSDGYIDRGSSDLKSYYLSGSWHNSKSSLKAIVFGGHEITYQAWYGTPESRIQNNETEMLAYALRNGLNDLETENLLTSGRTYNFYTYEKEEDNYKQDHYQLHFSHQFNRKLNLNTALHYTYGRGYYEQFRNQDDFAIYGFTPIVVDSVEISNTDLIRRRWLDNHFYGGIFNLNYQNSKGLEVILGGGLNAYRGDHFGEIIWAQYMPENEIRDRYYDNSSFKADGNLYLKTNYQIKKVNLFADIQYRHIDYSFWGIDENDGILVEDQQQVTFNFFNPKAGLSYLIKSNQRIYASYAIGNREPVRGDFRESTPQNRPKHETLLNLETGYRLNFFKGYFNANIYRMDYINQLVLTGEINDVGGYTRTNVDKSYRMGLEIDGAYNLTKKLGITGFITLSQNKIVAFEEFIDAYDINFNYLGQQEIVHSNTDLAFSPNLISGISLNLEPIKNFAISWLHKYVGSQYLDNTSNSSRQLDSYFISNLTLNYTIKNKLFKEIMIGLKINNLYNEIFENNGYTWGYVYDGVRVDENFYYPQAERNLMFRLTFKL